MAIIKNMWIVWLLGSGIVLAIGATFVKVKQITSNAKAIKGIRKNCAETTKGIHEELKTIGKQVAEMHGYLVGKNGGKL